MTMLHLSDRPPTVLVTGGAGFIGSHTVDRLAEAGCRVIVVDDLSTGKRENLARWSGNPAVELIEADIADGLFAPLAGATARLGPIECIVHLAARTSVPRSVREPLADVRVNYSGTVQVLEYARSVAARRVVFASSSAVYGNDAPLPTAESAPTRPVSPYGVNKLGCEHFLNYYGLVHGLRTTAFRFFNVYGPRQDPGSPYSGVISIFARQAASGGDLGIFGDGGQTRDFVFVGDVARTLAMCCLSGRGEGAVLNLGTGVATSIDALARAIVELARSSSSIRRLPPREGEIYASVADITAAHRLLGFRPEVTLRDGLRRTLL